MALFGTKKDDTGGKGADERSTIDARLDALGKQIDAIGGAMQSVSETNSRTAAALAGLVAGGAAGTKPGVAEGSGDLPKINLTGLPNPADDPDGFSRGLNDRLVATYTQAIDSMHKTLSQRQQAVGANQEFLDELSTDFDSTYPDLAGPEKSEYVKVAAKKILTRVQRQGLDVQKYIAADTDGFMERVAKSARVIMARETAEGDEGADTAKGGDDTAKGAVDPDPFRVMVMGGDAGSAGAAAKGDDKKDKSSFVGDLIAEQKRMRLY